MADIAGAKTVKKVSIIIASLYLQSISIAPERRAAKGKAVINDRVKYTPEREPALVGVDNR